MGRGSHADTQAAAADYPSVIAAGALVGLLIIATLNANVDDRVMALLVTPIQKAFRLSDTDIGLLQGLAISLCAGLAAFPIGMLIDRTNRLRLLWFAVVGWSVFTALSGLSENFWQLFVCRMGVGVTEFTATAALSLIADLFPADRLVTVMGFVTVGQIVGSSASITIGGLVVSYAKAGANFMPLGLGSLDPWRLTFLIAAIPGILLAIPLMLAREPTRKNLPFAVTREGDEISLSAYLTLYGRSVLCLCGSSILSGVGLGALLIWLPTALFRDYGVSTSYSGEWLGVVYGVGSLLGMAAGATINYFVQRRRGIGGTLAILRGGIVSSAVAFPALLLAQSTTQVLIATSVYVFLSFLQAGIAPGLTLYLVPNHLRGRFTALWNIIGLSVNAGWPPLIGLMSDRVFAGPHALMLGLCSVAIPCIAVASILVFGVSAPPGERALSAAAACP